MPLERRHRPYTTISRPAAGSTSPPGCNRSPTCDGGGRARIPTQKAQQSVPTKRPSLTPAARAPSRRAPPAACATPAQARRMIAAVPQKDQQCTLHPEPRRLRRQPRRHYLRPAQGLISPWLSLSASAAAIVRRLVARRSAIDADDVLVQQLPGKGDRLVEGKGKGGQTGLGWRGKRGKGAKGAKGAKVR